MNFSVLFSGSDDHLAAPLAGERDIVSTVIEAGDHVRVVNLVLASGAYLREHSSPHPILVGVLTGSIEFTCDGVLAPLTQGGLVSVGAGVPHAVRALSATSLLVTFLLGAGESD